MNDKNIFLHADSYKASHFSMYPKGTNKVYSYVESRGGYLEETVFFGLQVLVRKLRYMFPTMADVEEAHKFYKLHGEPFNYEGAKQLVELGYFPLEIKAVKEGTVLPSKNVLVSITNTHPDFGWLVSFLETILLNGTWYPTTVASFSRACKKIITSAYEKTVDNDRHAAIDFALQDFGFRGTSSIESAGIGALGHLVNFKGSDTVVANIVSSNHYNCDIAGFSVPAAEHSTITAWGKAGEVDAYINILDRYPTGVVSVVSDSYDVYHAVSDIFGRQLKERILARDGVFVVRPDSGDPITVLFGDKTIDLKTEVDEHRVLEGKGIIQILWERFGGYINSKGYKVLNDKVRILQGDGINIHSLADICDMLVAEGWSAENLVFGMGGGLLQCHDRDTMRFACKCSYIEIDGVGRDVFKNPSTDPGKKSKRGMLSLIQHPSGEYETVSEERDDDLLETVFLNSEIMRQQSLDEIRVLAEIA